MKTQATVGVGREPTTNGRGPGRRSPWNDRAALERLTRRITLADAGRELMTVHAPFTGEVLGRVPRGTTEDVREAVRRARSGRGGRSGRSDVRERARDARVRMVGRGNGS